jgi:hypothetical protein
MGLPIKTVKKYLSEVRYRVGEPTTKASVQRSNGVVSGRSKPDGRLSGLDIGAVSGNPDYLSLALLAWLAIRLGNALVWHGRRV